MTTPAATQHADDPTVVDARFSGGRMLIILAAGLWLGPALAQPTAQTPIDLSPELQTPQSESPAPPHPSAVVTSDPQQSADQPLSAFRPGFLDAFGRWVGNARTGVQTGIGKATGTLSGLGESATKAVTDAASTASDAAKAATRAAKGAIDSVGQLPSTGLVRGHERCAVAPNGGPDCAAAADTLCRAGGFNGGRVVDTQSAQDCPAHVWLRSSQPPPPSSQCFPATYVVRAVCR